MQHAGLTQTLEMPTIDGTRAVVEQDVRVFEATTVKPEWTIKMRHLIVDRNPAGAGLRVMEMIAVDNPGDRAWLGAEGDLRGPVTVEVPVPSASAGITAMDDRAGRIQFDHGKLINVGPLFPGVTTFQIGYVVSGRKGEATLSVVSPATTEHVMAIVPADGLRAQAQGLEAQGVKDLGRGDVQVFVSKGMKAGETATLTIAGLVGGAEPGALGMSSSAWFVIVGGVAMLLVTAGVMMLKKPKTAGKAV